MNSSEHLFFDPVILKLGPLEFRWYGLMYLVAFGVAYLIIKKELIRKNGPIPVEAAGDLLFYLILGLLLGARIGYVLFYNLPVYLEQPKEIFAVWHGGMSFHGGLIGMIMFGLIFSIRCKAPFWELADIGALAAPMGLMLGRIGNFINGELFGRPTNLPWGMIFPGAGDVPRHPSQIYEAILEGPILFLILWILRTRVKRPGSILAIFLMIYGLFRFIAEFFREPDPQLGFIFSGLTMGQILCLVMIGSGVALFTHLNVRSRTNAPSIST
ncbi:MAG: prolipoprotein diacylglyceryl transferase [Deltaproteobacteria bacterium]|nr:prolipoprotein diacylglyceryl transferase [Deltaproteobacteria bacterium]